MGGASTGKKRPGRKQTTGSETAAGTRVGHGQLPQRGPPRGPQRGGVDGGTGHRAEGAHSWPRGKGTHWGKTLAAELWTQPHAQDRGRKRPRHRALYFVMVTDVHAQPHRQTLRMKEPPPSTPMTMVPAAAAEGRGRVGGGANGPPLSDRMTQWRITQDLVVDTGGGMTSHKAATDATRGRSRGAAPHRKITNLAVSSPGAATPTCTASQKGRASEANFALATRMQRLAHNGALSLLTTHSTSTAQRLSDGRRMSL